MGREIRRVPPDWKHPTVKARWPSTSSGFQPLLDNGFSEAMNKWTDAWRKWNAGEDPDRAQYEAKVGHPVAYHEWNGGPPDPAYYRPEWPEASRTAYQVYETVSEGTPVSPVFPTRDEMIHWLVNDGTGMGIGGERLKLSREAAERFADAAWAPSMIGGAGMGVVSGLVIHEKVGAK